LSSMDKVNEMKLDDLLKTVEAAVEILEKRHKMDQKMISLYQQSHRKIVLALREAVEAVYDIQIS